MRSAGGSKASEKAKGKRRENDIAMEDRHIRLGAIGLELKILEARKAIIESQMAALEEELDEIRGF